MNNANALGILGLTLRARCARPNRRSCRFVWCRYQFKTPDEGAFPCLTGRSDASSRHHFSRHHNHVVAEPCSQIPVGGFELLPIRDAEFARDFEIFVARPQL